jgi:very-short-patch-repair endonuclease
MRTQSTIEPAIGRIADAQYGVVARAQLLALGLGADPIGRRVRCGRLRPLHRGVYAVGHLVLRREAHWLAAVLACGDGAVLSHAAAAAHWGLRPSAATRVDVTVRGTGGRKRPGLRVHRHATLLAAEITRHEGIPVTTPARTLLDLAASLPRRAVERALDQSAVLRLFDFTALCAAAEAHRGRPGAPLLSAVLEQHSVGSTLTRSELEERFLRFCAERGIVSPRVNATVAGLEVDFYWPRPKLVVEVDGWAFHRTRAAFERDRRRDTRLAAAGIRVLRLTDRQLATTPDDVARALQAVRSISSIRYPSGSRTKQIREPPARTW